LTKSTSQLDTLLDGARFETQLAAAEALRHQAARAVHLKRSLRDRLETKRWARLLVGLLAYFPRGQHGHVDLPLIVVTEYLLPARRHLPPRQRAIRPLGPHCGGHQAEPGTQT
jgi:hypothetical protein